MTKPLEGLRFLDFTHMLSGPFATMYLADLGAEVIKIEPPGGEGTRKLLSNSPGHNIEGMGAYFLTLGRNKKSITLDIKTPAGREVLHKLVSISDGVITNFRAGVAARLGLTYPQLSAINQSIVTCSITGFGESGPNANKSSFDAVAQAAGGGMYLTGDGKEPLRSGIPIGDLGGGLGGTIGLLAAIISAQRTGVGQMVEVSMQDMQVSMLNYMLTMQTMSKTPPPAVGNGHFVHVPYGSFECRDGYLIIAVITDKVWENLVTALDLRELRNSDFADQKGRKANKDFIEDTINTTLCKRPRKHWTDLLDRHGVPCSPVLSIPQVESDPHLIAREMVVNVPHSSGKTCIQPGNPIKVESLKNSSFRSPPNLGEHNNYVFKDLLKLTDIEIEALASSGVGHE